MTIAVISRSGISSVGLSGFGLSCIGWAKLSSDRRGSGIKRALFNQLAGCLAPRLSPVSRQGFAMPGIGGIGRDVPDVVERGSGGQFALTRFLCAAVGG